MNNLDNFLQKINNKYGTNEGAKAYETMMDHYNIIQELKAIQTIGTVYNAEMKDENTYSMDIDFDDRNGLQHMELDKHRVLTQLESIAKRYKVSIQYRFRGGGYIQ